MYLVTTRFIALPWICTCVGSCTVMSCGHWIGHGDLEYNHLMVSTSEHQETCSMSENVFVHQYSSVLITFHVTGQALMGREIIVQ